MGDIYCSDQISESKAIIMNTMFERIFSGYSSMTPNQKAQAKKDSDSIYELGISEDFQDYMQLLDNYYLTILPSMSAELFDERDKLIEELFDKSTLYNLTDSDDRSRMYIRKKRYFMNRVENTTEIM